MSLRAAFLLAPPARAGVVLAAKQSPLRLTDCFGRKTKASSQWHAAIA